MEGMRFQIASLRRTWFLRRATISVIKQQSLLVVVYYVVLYLWSVCLRAAEAHFNKRNNIHYYLYYY